MSKFKLQFPAPHPLNHPAAAATPEPDDVVTAIAAQEQLWRSNNTLGAPKAVWTPWTPHTHTFVAPVNFEYVDMRPAVVTNPEVCAAATTPKRSISNGHAALMGIAMMMKHCDVRVCRFVNRDLIDALGNTHVQWASPDDRLIYAMELDDSQRRFCNLSADESVEITSRSNGEIIMRIKHRLDDEVSRAVAVAMTEG